MFWALSGMRKQVTRYNFEILNLVEVRRHQLQTWTESDVIKFQRHVHCNWISAHRLITFKASHRMFKTLFLIVAVFFINDTLKEICSLPIVKKMMSQLCVFEDYAAICKSYQIDAIDFSFPDVVNFCLFHSFHGVIIFASRNRFLKDKQIWKCRNLYFRFWTRQSLSHITGLPSGLFTASSTFRKFISTVFAIFLLWMIYYRGKVLPDYCRNVALTNPWYSIVTPRYLLT